MFAVDLNFNEILSLNQNLVCKFFLYADGFEIKIKNDYMLCHLFESNILSFGIIQICFY